MKDNFLNHKIKSFVNRIQEGELSVYKYFEHGVVFFSSVFFCNFMYRSIREKNCYFYQLFLEYQY